ncbi:MAG: RsmE family RNA methyltransferase [Prochlorothrix sp.]
MNRIFLDPTQLRDSPHRPLDDPSSSLLRPDSSSFRASLSDAPEPSGTRPSGLWVAQLDREQRHYLTKVLRLKAGATIVAQLATGERWLAVLETGGDRLLLGDRLPGLPPEPVQITLIAALPKTGFDEVVRQATELGVGQIRPVFSDRTIPKPKAQAGQSKGGLPGGASAGDATRKKTGTKPDRWQRIAQEAAEQCERREIPLVRPPHPFRTALTELPEPSFRYLCVARDLAGLSAQWADRSPLSSLCQCVQRDLEHEAETAKPPEIILAIGPEGGWTVAEIETAIEAGFRPVSLGHRILRAVTAPLVALAQVEAARLG